MAATVEYRGVDNLVYAPVLTDDNEATGGYKTGPVKPLAPVAEVSRTVEESSAAKFYDNQPQIVIQSIGADTITITVPVLELATLADITCQFIDPLTGALSEGAKVPGSGYFAVGYRFKLTDGTYRYIWRYKGTFGTPDDASKTEDDSTDSTNQQLTFTGVATTHRFTKGDASAKANIVDERDGLADVSTFFDTVTTIDDLQTKTP